MKPETQKLCVVTSMRHYENTDETYFGADAVFANDETQTARQKAEAYVEADKNDVIESEELENPEWDPDTLTLTEDDKTFKWSIDELTVL